MKSFLIKIGKVKNILERDGFWDGGKKIWRKFLRVLKMILKWPKGKIIFISGLTGAVAMYRTKYVAEELNGYGFKADVLFGEDPFLVTKVRRFKIVVLNRVTWSKDIQKLLDQAEKLKQIIIYDTDDLTFDVELFKQSDTFKNFNDAQKEQYKKTTGLEIAENKQVKAITTATSFLAEKLKLFKKPVFVVKNKLSKQELQWTREARKIYLRRSSRDNKVRLGYFSGTVSHNKDFATIVPALKIILEKYKNVKLYLVGYLDVNDKFYREFSKQIVQLPFVPRREHYKNIAEVDINLAPLEMTDFCQAKSELKFFEAGIIGIPTVATRNQTFLEAINEESESLKGCVSCLHPKRNGLLAGDVTEWVKKLELLIENKEMRISIGERARQVVLKKYLTSSGGSREYYEFLESVISN